MNSYSKPTVTYVRERNEFRVSFEVNGKGRSTVGVCTVGGGFTPESAAWVDAAPLAIGAVNDWLNSKL